MIGGGGDSKCSAIGSGSLSLTAAWSMLDKRSSPSSSVSAASAYKLTTGRLIIGVVHCNVIATWLVAV